MQQATPFSLDQLAGRATITQAEAAVTALTKLIECKFDEE